MNSRSTAGRPRAILDALTIAVFLALLCLPTLDFCFNLDHARMPTENRRLAVWPEFGGVGRSRDFITGIENYFNDHFGFRKRLIRWNLHWKDGLFKDGNGDVIVGRDGWLFCSGERMFEHWSRVTVFSGKDLEDWRRLLEMRRDWLAARGIKYLLVVAPDKHNVYPEFLPEWMDRSPKPSKIQQLVKYMKDRSTVEVVDLRPALIEAKKLRVDYLKTDTHWNCFGGFVAYQAVVRALARQMPGLEPLPLDALKWRPAAHPSGDLARMGRKAESTQETQEVEPVPLKREAMLEFEPIYDPARLPQHGAKEMWPCLTLNEKAAGKAVVFRDSFSCSWYPYLRLHFKEVIYIWHYHWDKPLIEREKPNVVIDEILERFFNIQDPTELAGKDQRSVLAAEEPPK